MVDAMDMSDAVIVKSSRLKSVVWNDFDRLKKGETCVAVCRHCKKKLSGSSTSGTSHLRNHLIRCQRRSNHGISNHPISEYFPAKEKKKEGVNIIDQERKDGVLNPVSVRYENVQVREDSVSIGTHNNLDQRRSRFDLARMMIIHGYPLTMVEHVGFKVFIRNLQPSFELVAFDSVESDCMEIYAKEKQKVFDLLDKLPGKISVSADVWTGSGDAEYLCLTAHYIDEDWQLRKKVLNFIMVDPCHTEDMHAEVIMTCLMEWDIDRKLFAMTFDNHSSNDQVVGRIRDRLSQNRFLYCNGRLFDVRCATNVIDLMAQDALGALSEITLKIRESIAYIRSSVATQSKFDELACEASIERQDKSFSVDNPSRWNSTYLMLQAAIEHKEAFCLLQQHDADYTVCPSNVEWERACTIVGFLKLFVEVTNFFTKAKYQTANMYFPEICDIHLQLIEWCSNPDECVSSLATKMREKFDEYWKKCSLGLAVSAVLDPRLKMKLIEYYYPQLYNDDAADRINDVIGCVKALYNEHCIGSPLSSMEQWQMNDNTSSARDPSYDRLLGFDKYLHETSQSEGSTSSDLDKYLEEPLFPRNGEFNVLNWWKVHTPSYPILSMMARNILGIPMSKVTHDTAFHCGRNVLNGDWGALRPSTVHALMCSQDWIRSELES